MAEMNGTYSDESGVIQEGQGAERVSGRMSAHVPVTNSPIRKGWAGDRKTGHEVDGRDGGETRETKTFVIGTTSGNFKVGLYASIEASIVYRLYTSCHAWSLDK